MKKRLLTLTLLILSIAFSLLLCACKSTDSDTEKTPPPKREQATECEHKWETKSQILPSCMNEGETVMSCMLCSESMTVSLPKTECSYTPTFDLRDNSFSYIDLICDLNPLHKVSIIAMQDIEEIESTCIEHGKTVIKASGVYKGVLYTMEPVEIEKPLAKCNVAYDYTLLTKESGCAGGYEGVGTCLWCGTAFETNIEYNHYSLEYTHIPLPSDTTCGGEVEVFGCLCGKKKTIKVLDNCPSQYVDVNVSVSNSDGLITETKTQVCSICLRKDVTVSTYKEKNKIIRQHVTVYAFDGTVLFDDESYNHDNEGHTLTYKCNPDEIKSCVHGYRREYTCLDCDFTDAKFITTHEYESTVTVLNSTSSSHYAYVRDSKSCLCGYVSEERYIYYPNCAFFTTDIEKVLPDGYTALSGSYAHECSCRLIHYKGTLIKDEDGKKYSVLIFAKDGSVLYFSEKPLEDTDAKDELENPTGSNSDVQAAINKILENYTLKELETLVSEATDPDMKAAYEYLLELKRHQIFYQ